MADASLGVVEGARPLVFGSQIGRPASGGSSGGCAGRAGFHAGVNVPNVQERQTKPV